MGKDTKHRRDPQSTQAGNIHERIQTEAKQAKEAPRRAMRDAEETPALAILLEAAREAVGKALPSQFEIDGKTYWLRCSIGLVRYEVFDGPASATPLATGVGGSYEQFGHTPTH
jgi:hypothetical protein